MEVDLIRQFIDTQSPNLNWLWSRCQKKNPILPSCCQAFCLQICYVLHHHWSSIPGLLFKVLSFSSHHHSAPQTKFNYGLVEVFSGSRKIQRTNCYNFSLFGVKLLKGDQGLAVGVCHPPCLLGAVEGCWPGAGQCPGLRGHDEPPAQPGFGCPVLGVTTPEWRLFRAAPHKLHVVIV